MKLRSLQCQVSGRIAPSKRCQFWTSSNHYVIETKKCLLQFNNGGRKQLVCTFVSEQHLISKHHETLCLEEASGRILSTGKTNGKKESQDDEMMALHGGRKGHTTAL